MERSLLQRFLSQMSRGELILFTGAGFSLAASNRKGTTLPSVNDLRGTLWEIAFPNEPLDSTSSLADIFEVALKRAGNRTGQILKDLLSVNENKLPQCYKVWFSLPWARIYTLNIDDLDEAIQRIYDLPRPIQTVSALKDSFPTDLGSLLSIHLNGRLQDFPDVTFSQRQYGERTARPDAWYHHLVTDISGHPVLFVGTQLDEAPLWQQIELRRGRGREARELRPGSYLVMPSISVARRAMLEDYNVQFVPMTQEQFASEILQKITTEKQQGFEAITDRRATRSKENALQNLSELRNRPSTATGEYLLGREPVWSDILSGTAVKREFETNLKAHISDSHAQAIIITGTAGSGKSTTVMRLALEYQAQGKNVFWLNMDTDFKLPGVRNDIRQSKADVLVIDDVDNFGNHTGPFIANLVTDNPDLVVIASMRSTRYHKLEIEEALSGLPMLAYPVPHLEDSDINLLLDALTNAGRLGQLRKLTRMQQEAVFRDSSGRQLLVAMIEATSGEKFEEKISRECRELGNESGLIYSVVAIATKLRSYLTRDEILLAMGDSSNASMNRIQSLIKQHLLVEIEGNKIRLRHRVIADHALTYYKASGQLGEPLKGLLWAMSTKVYPELSRQAREFRLLIKLMSHGFMVKLTSDSNIPRQAYSAIEGLLDWDYHYYLQRGSYEVERGDINLAKNFLEQARALSPTDHMVQTEWAYMSLKRAALNTSKAGAGDQADEAIRELEDAIEKRGKIDFYPYHVLGSQGLRWVRSALISKEEKAQLLSRLLKHVRQGVKFHPKRPELRQLAYDVEKEHLLLTVHDPKK